MRHLPSTLRPTRLGAATAAVGLGAALVVAPVVTVIAAGPAAASLPDPTVSASYFLQQQLIAGGDHLSVTFDGTAYADAGLTADAIIALGASGTGQDAAVRATNWLSNNLGTYIGEGSESYAGAVGKALNVAIIQGQDPTSFGGVDLVARAVGHVDSTTGRIKDASQWGDYANTFGQAFTVIGLSRVDNTADAAAAASLGANYLALQQCPGGGFTLNLSDTQCADAAQADPDSTSLAVQALLAVGGHAGAVSDGLDYLAEKQDDATGGVGGGTTTEAHNANSTGLAGQAFLAGGRVAQARLATSFVSALQYDCTFAARVQGGIAYDTTAYDANAAAGDAATPSDQDVRATAQAVLALAGTPLGTVTAVGAEAVAPAPSCATETTTTSATTTQATTGTTTGGETTDTETTTVETTDTQTTTVQTSAPVTSDPGSTTTPISTPAPTSTTDDSGTGNGSNNNGSGTGSGNGSANGPLAETGTDIAVPVSIGTTLVTLGAALLIFARRRKPVL